MTTVNKVQNSDLLIFKKMSSCDKAKSNSSAKDMKLEERTYSSACPTAEPSHEKIRKLAALMYPSLPTYETSLLTATWIFIIGYSWYLVYNASREYFHNLAVDGYMKETWFNHFTIFKFDSSDEEWNASSKNLIRTIPWIIFHFIGSQILRRSNDKFVPIFNVLLSIIHMTTVIRTKATIWIVIQPLFMFLIHLFGSPFLIWMAAIACLFEDMEISGPLNDLNNYFCQGCTEEEYDLIHITWHWVNLRCISFCLDRISNDVDTSLNGRIHDIIEMLAYCFYLPINMFGPIIIYKDFHEGFKQEYRPWTLTRLKDFLLQILRYTSWFLIGHVSLHFFYQSSLTYRMDILRSLGLWTLAGIGLCVGGFFNLKYIVYYGFPKPFIIEDGIDKAPRHPICIYRITRYSEMWRYFDNGLYMFLRKYIYLPIVGNRKSGQRRIVGATITFIFIYLWHEMSFNVLLWSVFNYLAVMTETIATTISKHPTYMNFEYTWFSPEHQRRFHALLVAPLFVASVLANFYFLMGTEVGNYCVYRAFCSWPFETPTVILFAYIGVQFSIEVKNWELRNEINHEMNK